MDVSPLLISHTPPKSFSLSNLSTSYFSHSCLAQIKTHTKKPSKPLKFKEASFFPQSLPLHTKNPHITYKDIQNFARQGKLKEALTILDYLEKHGIPLNPTTFSSLLSACARLKLLTEGKQIHVHIRINGLESNEFLCTKLVQMYSACGSIEDAKKVFEEMPNTSVFSWNALLRGNVINGYLGNQGTIETYYRMHELGEDLDEYTFSCLIKRFAGSPALGQGMKVHALLMKNGLLSFSDLLMTGLMDMYFKCGKVRLARQLFEEVGVRDVVVWGTMIVGFAHNGLRWEALEYTRWMRRDRITPNSVILTMVLPVIGEMSAKKLGQEVHGYVIKTRDYSKQLFIQSTLIDMYCKCGDMISGRTVFYRSMERNAISWTALMSGYASNGRLEQALRSLIWMQQEGVKPDVVSIATVLPICGELKALKQGKEIHSYALKFGFLPNVSISTSLMVMYSKCGKLESSCKVFDVLEKKNVICWMAMIDAYLKNCCFFDAIRVFRSMQTSKHRPDSVAMAQVLTACGELLALKLGKEFHGQLLRRGMGSIPFVSSAVIKFYGKCGEIEKSKLVFDEILLICLKR